jgi:hypothetical protein
MRTSTGLFAPVKSEQPDGICLHKSARSYPCAGYFRHLTTN